MAAAPKEKNMISVVTTAVGSLGPQGLVQPGERHNIDVSLFSDNWMRPATQACGKKIAAYRREKAASQKISGTEQKASSGDISQAVQDAVSDGLEAIEEAKGAALEDIQTAKAEMLEEVENAKREALADIEDAQMTPEANGDETEAPGEDDGDDEPSGDSEEGSSEQSS